MREEIVTDQNLEIRCQEEDNEGWEIQNATEQNVSNRQSRERNEINSISDMEVEEDDIDVANSDNDAEQMSGYGEENVPYQEQTKIFKSGDVTLHVQQSHFVHMNRFE